MKVERAVRSYLTRRVLAEPWPSAPSLIQRNERRGEEGGEGKEGLEREDFCNQEGKRVVITASGATTTLLAKFYR